MKYECVSSIHFNGQKQSVLLQKHIAVQRSSFEFQVVCLRSVFVDLAAHARRTHSNRCFPNQQFYVLPLRCSPQHINCSGGKSVFAFEFEKIARIEVDLTAFAFS